MAAPAKVPMTTRPLRPVTARLLEQLLMPVLLFVITQYRHSRSNFLFTEHVYIGEFEWLQRSM